MSLPQLSLSKKIIILLGLPVLIQLGIVGGLTWLEACMQSDWERAETARHIRDCINHLLNEKYRLEAACDSRTVITLLELGKPMLNQEQSGLYKLLMDLQESVKDRPNELAIVRKSEQSAQQALAILHDLKEMFDQGNIQERAETRPLVDRLKRITPYIVSPELTALGDREAELLEASPVVQKRLHEQARWLIGLGGCLNLLLTAGAAFYLLSRVARRLDHLLEDTTNFAQRNNLPQRPSSEESDEIARLDVALQALFLAVCEISAKQMAVVDNAGDMVCTLDENGKITSTNAAGGKLFGCHQADLIGKHYRNLVHRKDLDLLSDYLQRARAGTPGQPIKLRCVGKNKRNLVVSWSAHWTTSEDHYFSVVHDITHMQEAQRMKQEIVSIVTRELAAPINNLQEFLDLLEEGSVAKIEERGQRLVVSARRNADQMLMLVNDMIDLEKAKSGMLAFGTEEIYLDNVIDRAQVMVAPFAEEKDIILDCRRSELAVRGEEDMLLRIFANLLRSAVQRAPRETSVLLVSKGQEGRGQETFVQISISDKGTTLSKDQVGTIFDAYAQNADPQALQDNTHKGSILGMAVSKAFVELLGGSISAASREGEGTTISFTLPLASSGVQKARTN